MQKRAEIDFSCPRCKAGVGVPCRKRGRSIDGYHTPRVDKHRRWERVVNVSSGVFFVLDDHKGSYPLWPSIKGESDE